MTIGRESLRLRTATEQDLGQKISEDDLFRYPADIQVAIAAALLYNLGYTPSQDVRTKPLFVGEEWRYISSVKIRNNFHAEFPDTWEMILTGDEKSNTMSFELNLLRKDKDIKDDRRDKKDQADTTEWATEKIIENLLKLARNPRRPRLPILPQPNFIPTTPGLIIQLQKADFAHGVVVDDYQFVSGLNIHPGPVDLQTPTSRYGTISLLTHSVVVVGDVVGDGG